MKVIKNATLFCPVLKKIEQGSILFDEQQIHAVGKNISIPEGTEVIDGTGKYVCPGFIDTHTHQGLFDGTIGWAGQDGNEMTDPVTPEVRGWDSFNPHDPEFKKLVKGGVTTIHTGPGSGNVIGGQWFIVKPVGDVVDKMIVKAPSALKVAFGENPKRIHGLENKRMPMTRMGIAALLRKALNDAKDYMNEWDFYTRQKEEAEKDGKITPKPPKTDLKLEVLVKVLKKEIPITAHAHRADDIATSIRIAKEFDFNLISIHCTEGHKIANYIAENKIPVVIGPSLIGGEKPEMREVSFQTAVDLIRSGVKVCLQTDSLPPMNFFQLLPINIIKLGISREEALKTVTINPAEVLGINDKIGSLEVGKNADIVIWSGDPFDYYNKVEKVFIDGIEVNI